MRKWFINLSFKMKLLVHIVVIVSLFLLLFMLGINEEVGDTFFTLFLLLWLFVLFVEFLFVIFSIQSIFIKRKQKILVKSTINATEASKAQNRKSRKRKIVRTGFVLLVVFSILTFLITLMDSEQAPLLNLNDLKNAICQNIASRKDLLDGITEQDLASIKSNLSVIEDSELEKMFSGISKFWENDKSKKIPRKIQEVLSSTLNDFSENAEESKTGDIEAFLNYYNEQSKNSFYVFENIANFLIDGNSMIVEPLEMECIFIDGIPYEKNAVDALVSYMTELADVYTQQFTMKISEETDYIYDIYIQNIDSYLDWFYSFSTSLFKSGYAISDLWNYLFSSHEKEDSANSNHQDYMVNNYVKRISYGTSFEKMADILSSWRQRLIDSSLIFALSLEETQISTDFIVAEKTISGNDYMASLMTSSNIMEHIIADAVPYLTMGQKIDKDGIMIIDLADTVINFIPGVGFIAGFVVDAVAQKVTEVFQRDEFRQEIKISILESKQEFNKIFTNIIQENLL